MRHLFLVALLCLFAAVLNAAPLAPQVRAEVDALLSALEKSGCEFNRNGSWYAAKEARTHLLRKLEYLEGKNAVQRTEQFIDLAASASSSSGKPYLVRCGKAAPVESRAWLTAQLAALRASAAGPRP
jgi:ATP phosphoribosyltransferase regulatory subunit HisZ